MKERNYTVDFLKLIAIIAVIVIHVSTAFLDRSTPFSFSFDLLLFINQLSRFAVPLFFAVSGYLLAAHYKEVAHPLNFYKRRARILIPYFVWTLIYFLIVFPHPLSK